MTHATARRRRAPRGSALVLVVILLAAMTAVSVAVLRLSGQGRIGAATLSSHEALVECANAAKAQLWAAIATNGKSYIANPSSSVVVTSLTLPDGKELLAPAHLDSGSTSTPSAGIRQAAASSPTGIYGDMDATNTIVGGGANSGSGNNQATWVTARCRDQSGRMHEVEFAFRFSL